MKKFILIIVIILIVITSFLVNWELKFGKCWGVSLLGFYKQTVLFSNASQDGEEIVIRKYYSKERIKKIIEKNNMEKIYPGNIIEVQDNLSDFYKRLDTNIKNINGKEVYDKSINVDYLLKLDNYYVIKRKNESYNESYIILILDIEKQTLYMFMTA